jgi:hypothetical protein
MVVLENRGKPAVIARSRVGCEVPTTRPRSEALGQLTSSLMSASVHAMFRA